MAHSMSYPNFKYEPLRHARSIRLIKVRPSRKFDDPIEISLFSINLDQHCDYQTLSYTNHDPTNSSTPAKFVLCRKQALYVSSNLHDFLRRLRNNLGSDKRHVELPIWIDAISINQPDLNEISYQMAMMAEIYKNSTHLLIWLGEASASEWKRWSTNSQNNHWRRERKVIKGLIQHPWFWRRWIIQEVVLGRGRDIWVGEELFKWKVFMAAVDRAILRESSIPPILKSSADVWLNSRPTRSLLENLWFWDSTECGNPSDRVYALLSISQDRKDFTINCNDSADVLDSRVAEHVVKSQILANITALLVCAICRSSTMAHSNKGLKKKSPHQLSERPAKKLRTSLQEKKLVKHVERSTEEALAALTLAGESVTDQNRSHELMKASVTANAKAARSEINDQSRLPSWVPDWEKPRRRFTTQERECVEHCFGSGTTTQLGNTSQCWTTIQRQSALLQKRYLHLMGWLFLACQCGKGQACLGCHRAKRLSEGSEPESGSTAFAKKSSQCFCVACKSPLLGDCSIFSKGKQPPPISAKQALCLLPGSDIAFILSELDDGVDGEGTIYRLDTCFLVLPVIGNASATFQFGEVREIVLA